MGRKMTAFALQVLGGFDLRGPQTEPIALATRKGWALLALLIASKGRVLSREDVAGQLWPHASEGQARASLRQELAPLRKALGRADLDGLVALKDRISCRFPKGMVDVLEFERLLDLGDPTSQRAALALYHGDFMAGLTLRADPFEDWLWLERTRLRNRAQGALMTLLAHDLTVGQDAITAQTAQKLLEVEPTQEQGYRALMQIHWRAGDRAAALQVYQRGQKTLRRDLDTEPSQDLVALADRIRAETRPSIQSAHKTKTQRGRAAVLCFGFAGMEEVLYAPEDHLKAQIRLRNRVLNMVSAAGGHVVAGAMDRVVAVLCSGAYERDCKAAIEVALGVIATPIVAGDLLAICPSAGIAGGEVLVPVANLRAASTDDIRFVAGAPLNRATRRVGLAEPGALVAGLEVPELLSDRYDVTVLASGAPRDADARRVRPWAV